MPRHQGRQTEPSVNTALGELLKGMLPGCTVRSEHTRLIVGHPGLQLDNLITAPDRAPVAVEAEYLPAHSVEPEATARLGLRVVGERNPIEASIALRYPQDVGYADDLRTALSGAELSYALFTRQGEDLTRFPATGWLTGSVTDLADLLRLASIPQHAVDTAATALEEGIDRAVTILHDMAATRPAIATHIAGLLGMADVPQTRRMACAIIANALVFHERLAGMHEEVKPLHLVCGPSVPNPQAEILTAWSHILDINYWAIFAIARDLVAQLPSDTAAHMLGTLHQTAQHITTAGVTNAHDLTGRIFQRLIADRKYLATFYTLPASAALLARLAVAKLNGVDWADTDAIANLRVGDFACGTGALLSAVYEQIATQYERTGGNPAQLHPAMMEEVLYGCDVMPSAIHITGSTLSGMWPQVQFGKSRLYTLAYGRQPDDSVRIGSLELLQSSEAMTLFNTSDPAKRTGSVGEETASQIITDIEDQGFDLVIMNPPFTRNTTNEGAYTDQFNAAFAAFGASDADQRDMGKRLTSLKKDTCYHGNAGIASAFVALAHHKLKPGGVLALVLPLSAASGRSWQRFREMLTRSYKGVAVLSLAANDDDISFSSDTGMAECLIVARKADSNVEAPHTSPHPQSRGHFISLKRRPQSFAHAAAIATGITRCEHVRRIEDGPYGGTPLMVGGEFTGEMLTVPCGTDGETWAGVRLADSSLAQTAYALSRSRLWLPGRASALELKTASLGVLSRLGLHHRDIVGPPPRGPFTKADASPTATYPALWNHNAKNETQMVCAPDSQLLVRPGLEEKAARVWETASHAHITLDFRFNSQPLATAITEQKSIGGRAWPNVTFLDRRFDITFAVWCNSTLGLLLYWWHANRQQAGRGITAIRAVETLPVLDFRTLSADQLLTAETIFSEFRDMELLSAYLADADPNRALLDRRVVCDLLGFDEDTYHAVRRLAAKWCAEPSVHGGKGRPKGAGLVV